jgi:predicted AlkP superfamily phosphohydrolase/phosphomutase/tetratricopeptide (TPR) repeat protein
MTKSDSGNIGTPAKKVLLIGWDAAEWKIIRPLVQRGWMPNLARLMERGYWGWLQAGHPLLSPTLWTSIVTGRHPTRHEVLGALEVSRNGSTFAPIGRAACKSEAIWTILDRLGIPCHTINFPATHPAEHLHGVSVSNVFPIHPDSIDSVWPANARDVLEGLRVLPCEIDESSLLTFVPGANEIDVKRDSRLKNISAILAHTATVHAAATWALEHVPWGFAAVCYTGLHQFSHGFMAYHPPHLAGISQRDFELYQNVITAAYRFHDLMLGRLMMLSGEETQIILVSDHGFQTDRLRPTMPITNEREMLAWHRQQGIAVMGMERKRGNVDSVISVFDIAPTILGRFGIPPADGMRGRALFGVAERPVGFGVLPRDKIIPSEPLNMQSCEEEDDATVEYLRGLGYIEQPDIHAELSARALSLRRQYNLGIAWLDAGYPGRAAIVLEELARGKPDDIEYRAGLARAYAEARRIGDCRRLVNEFLSEFPDSGQALAAAGMLEIAARRAGTAIEHLRKAEGMGLRSAGLLSGIGQAYLRLRMFEDARRAFESAIALDDELAAAYRGLGAALLGEGDAVRAAEACRRAAALRPDVARNHYDAGLSLMQLGQFPEAQSAFQKAIGIEPEFAAALRKLSEVCERMGNTMEARDFDRRAYLAAARRRIAAFEESDKARPFPG